MKTKPQWNAYVAEGADKEERRKRLEEVPDEWRDAVRRHVETYFTVRRYENRKRKMKR